MSQAVDLIDQMIAETIEKTKDVPHFPWYINTGIDLRFALLREVRNRLIKSELEELTSSEESEPSEHPAER